MGFSAEMQEVSSQISLFIAVEHRYTRVHIAVRHTPPQGTGMTIPDKFSAARQQQIDFFQQLTSRAFENAERMVALNMATTRATIDFGRQLFEMTNQPAANAAPAAPAAAPPAPAAAAAPGADHIDTAAPVIVSEPVSEPVSAPEPAPAFAPEPEPEAAASTIQPTPHPLGEADPEPAPAPVVIAKAKPIAKAVSKVAAQTLDVPHPAASPMPPEGPVDIPAIAPVDASAPPPAKRSTGAAKGGRKR